MPVLRRDEAAAAGSAGCFANELDAAFPAGGPVLIGSDMESLHEAVPIVPQPANATAAPSIAKAANIRTLMPTNPPFVARFILAVKGKCGVIARAAWRRLV
jgi:hypothetical protein